MHIFFSVKQTTRWLIGNVLHIRYTRWIRRTRNVHAVCVCIFGVGFFCLLKCQRSHRRLHGCICNAIEIKLSSHEHLHSQCTTSISNKIPSHSSFCNSNCHHNTDLMFEERKRKNRLVLHGEHCWRSPTFRFIRQYIIIFCARKKIIQPKRKYQMSFATMPIERQMFTACLRRWFHLKWLLNVIKANNKQNVYIYIYWKECVSNYFFCSQDYAYDFINNWQNYNIFMEPQFLEIRTTNNFLCFNQSKKRAIEMCHAIQITITWWSDTHWW